MTQEYNSQATQRHNTPTAPDSAEAIDGITISLSALIQARPAKGITGFSPRGKVNTHQWGSYPSAFKGRGMEFVESRVYQVGDDIKNIDWRMTARTGETYTKLFQEERERPVSVLVDMRQMMQYGSKVRFKAHLAAEVAAQLAWVAYDGGDRVGGHLLTRTGCRDFRGARTRRALLRFLEGLAQETRFQPPYATATRTEMQTKTKTQAQAQAQAQSPTQASSSTATGEEMPLATGIRRLRHLTRPGALVFIISDFYDSDATTRQELLHLSAHAHVTLIHISDPLDAHLPENAGQVSDGQALLSLSSLSDKQREAYAAAYQTRCQRLQQLCLQHGMVFHALTTSDDAKHILQYQAAHHKRAPHSNARRLRR